VTPFVCQVFACQREKKKGDCEFSTICCSILKLGFFSVKNDLVLCRIFQRLLSYLLPSNPLKYKTLLLGIFMFSFQTS